MKNSLIIFFVLTKFIFFFYTPVFSNEIKFEATNIETIDKNLIVAEDNIIISDNYGNKIYADKLKIENEKIYTISENVIFENTENGVILKSDKIIYNK